MRIFINKRLNIALDKAITSHIDSEIAKFDSYDEYGYYIISQQAFCDALRYIGEALERRHGITYYPTKLYHFSWSEVL